MALYGDMKKPLHFKDRAEAKAWYSEHIDGYKGLTEKLNKLDEEYQSKYDAQETSNDEYYEQNYEAYVADDAEVTKKSLKMRISSTIFLNNGKRLPTLYEESFGSYWTVIL